MKRLLRCGAAAIVCWMSSADTAAAIELEKLLMPGPVIEGHARTESECGACHSRLGDRTQKSLCLECHEEVAADPADSPGFHGRAPGLADTPCRTCHTEHRGREADVADFDPASFDHDLTDLPLRGAHGRTACAACHEPENKPRDAPADCWACHEDDDTHRGSLGEACGDCHSEVSWDETRFDHSETEFPLEGEHVRADCVLCHTGGQFESTASDCNSCHRVDDIHRGRFGADCGDCHTPQDWLEVRFDHERETEFALEDAPALRECERWHADGLGDTLATACAACHEADDVHRGRNGTDCEQCHRETRWADESFDHGQMTDFPLLGAHSDVKCERCHTGPRIEQEPTRPCAACHESDDVHAGQLGEDCGACHDESAWTGKIFFEHDVTAFPLLGLHAVVSCEQCHATARFSDTPSSCWDCHADTDTHLRRLGTECAECHNPNGWDRWRFDHAERTEYPLTEAHAELECEACHRLPVDGPVSATSECASCHARDDRHAGAFGRDCERCHSATFWDAIDLRELH